MQDGLATANLTVGSMVATDISGTAPYVESVELGSGAVMNVNISGGQCSGTKVDTGFGTVKTGSPPAGGMCIQCGTGTVGAGSTVWVVFGNSFAAAPNVVAMYNDTTLGYLAGSPIGIGSVLITGETASKKFDWIAVGSGRV